jgi:hypothetical protein
MGSLSRISWLLKNKKTAPQKKLGRISLKQLKGVRLDLSTRRPGSRRDWSNHLMGGVGVTPGMCMGVEAAVATGTILGVGVGVKGRSAGSGYFWHPRNPESARTKKPVKKISSFFFMESTPGTLPTIHIVILPRILFRVFTRSKWLNYWVMAEF